LGGVGRCKRRDSGYNRVRAAGGAGKDWQGLLESLMKQYVIVILAVGLMTAVVGCGGSGPAAANSAAQEAWVSTLPSELGAAHEKLANGKASKALKLVEKWKEANGDSEYMDKALYLEGKAYFAKKLYYQAYKAYEELLDGYATSELFSEVLEQEVEIARLFLAGAKRKVWKVFPISARSDAIVILERVTERWPGSALAGQALMMQADYYMSQKRYLEAQQTYQLVVEHYKDSPYYLQALRQNAEATYAQYHGSRYDTVCLEEARIRYQRYHREAPGKMDRAEIDGQLDIIEHYQVAKELEIADFYRRTGQIAAARYYWNSICQRWGDTDKTAQAQVLLEEYQ